MNVRASLLALLSGLLVLGVAPAGATELPGEGGPGTDTSWHKRSLYGSGDPTKQRDTWCQGRMAGPYPDGRSVVEARFRVECRDRPDLSFTSFVARLKNLDANYSKNVTTDRCLPADSTRRVAANDVEWFGCTYKLRVTDKRPARVQDWQSMLAVSHEITGPDGSVANSTVVAYCYDHRTYCSKNPGVVAARYWVG